MVSTPPRRVKAQFLYPTQGDLRQPWMLLGVLWQLTFLQLLGRLDDDA